MPRPDIDRSVGDAREWLSTVRLGEPSHHLNLTLFPLFHDKEPAAPAPDGSPTWPGGNGGGNGSGVRPRYTLLADAIEAGTATVQELDEDGQVPFLGVKNDGGLPILIPEGEVLVGAKQNRVVNLTVLVAARSTFKLPVSCVEQGRWRYRSRRFEAEAFAHPKLRELKIKSAQLRRRELGVAMSDQRAVWDEVEEHLCAFETPSPTLSMTDAYARVEGRIEDYRKKVTLPDGACGFLVTQGARAVGLDLFDVPTTMTRLWRRLTDAYFVEALREGRQSKATSEEVASAFLVEVVEKLALAAEQPELGVELELEDGATADETADRVFPNRGGVAGSALWYQGAVCHLAAFSA